MAGCRCGKVVRAEAESVDLHGEGGAMIVVVMGVSGCDKSTVAKALAAACGWQFLDADDFHPPANVAKMGAGIPLTDEDRWPWLDRMAGELAAILGRGEHAVLACSAL
jgi:gluconokinase